MMFFMSLGAFSY